jgi:SAM-dependent methyltransferase
MTTVLDAEYRPLSQSSLWDWQRNYYDEQGIRAWSDAVVPQYITSNAWIATSYAQVVAAWIRDEAASLDPGAPVDIIELGCGSGRFGYLFLRRLRELVRGIRVRYVYTDFTDYNLDILRSHPSLQPLVEEGAIDFARFDVENDRELQLSNSGDVLRAGSSRNPLVVLANYVFDALRNDCFRVTPDSELQSVLVRAETTPGETGEQFVLSCDAQTLDAPPYGDDSWNAILETYRRLFPGSVVLFPRGALTALDHLREISGGRMLLVSGDKGYVQEDAVRAGSEPHLAQHGSFSMMVNYHALGQWTRAIGGRFLQTTHRFAPLHIVASVFGGTSSFSPPEVDFAFDAWIERRGPADFFLIKQATQAKYDAFTVHQLIAMIRFSGWDHVIFLAAFETLIRLAEDASEAERAELGVVAHKVWETYFPLREPVDLPFHAAALLFAAGRPADAAALFEESIRWYGPDSGTSMNLALCHAALERFPEALELAREALEMDSEMESARELIATIESRSTIGTSSQVEGHLSG